MAHPHMFTMKTELPVLKGLSWKDTLVKASRNDLISLFELWKERGGMGRDNFECSPVPTLRISSSQPPWKHNSAQREVTTIITYLKVLHKKKKVTSQILREQSSKDTLETWVPWLLSDSITAFCSFEWSKPRREVTSTTVRLMMQLGSNEEGSPLYIPGNCMKHRALGSPRKALP